MIYLDANSTSRIRPEVAQGLYELLDSGCELRNPSSVHSSGRGARAALSKARRSLLRLLGGGDYCRGRVVFTSGGTEACNSLIYGFLPEGTLSTENAPHVVTSTIEHQAVLEPLMRLEQRGINITRIAPGLDGIVDVEAFSSPILPQTKLVILMAANNVTGAVQPIGEVALRLRRDGYQGMIISDVTQALAKSPLIVSKLFEAGVDGVALSGHKLGAPSGAGAFVFAENSDRCQLFTPLLAGGPQEERYRAGTENLLGIVGLGLACDVLVSRREGEINRVAKLREKLWHTLNERLTNLIRFTPEATEDFVSCLSNTLAIRIPGVRGDDLVVALDLRGLCISTGSACASGRQEVSHVFRQVAGSEEAARECVRISLDWDANERELLAAGDVIVEVVKQMQSLTLAGEGVRLEPLRA